VPKSIINDISVITSFYNVTDKLINSDEIRSKQRVNGIQRKYKSKGREKGRKVNTENETKNERKSPWQVSVVRGLGLSITALKSRGRPQSASTIDSLPAVEVKVTCRSTTPALLGP
jgi:hypothetical protein